MDPRFLAPEQESGDLVDEPRAAHVRPRTQSTSAADLAVFLGWLDRQGVDPLRAGRGDIDRYCSWMSELVGADGKPSWQGEPRFAPATVVERLSAVRSFYGYLVQCGAIDASPAVDVMLPRTPRTPREHAITADQPNECAARRRRRRQRIGAVVAAVAIAAVAVVVMTGAGGRAATGSKIARRAPSVAAPDDPKPVPPALLPRGGRTLLPGHLIVAFYGIVGTSNVLGRSGDPEADAAGVEREARAYRRFGRPVQPAFELVTTFASPTPGPEGTYSAAIDRATVQQYLDAAHRHKLLLILDFQPGRGEFLSEVRRYARFLVDPSVGVALDPEWKLTGTQVPDQVIGSSPASSINAVSAYLSRLVRARRLPQKLLIVHEFETSELPDRQNIVSRSGLATVLQMDGLGPVSTKLKSYQKVMRSAHGFHPGFKVFLRPVDDPVLLAPGQIMRLRPRPDYVSYQ